MKRAVALRRLAVVGAALMVSTGGSAWADDESLPTGGSAGGPYRIDAMTIDAGGGRSGTGPFVVEGTAGQHDADPLQPSSGGVFSITGGLWPAATVAAGSDRLFADGFEGQTGASGSVQSAN